MSKQSFYLSTSIPYVNSNPHIGFALEIIQADVIARYHRVFGEEVFFLTGTDENSLKNVRAAEKEGISVKKLVDKNAKKFYNLKEILNLSFDNFIRTTEKRHIKGSQKLWRACQKDIYKKRYRGLYCVGCEEFYKERDLVNGLCPEHKTKLELIEEEDYFFKLSKYQNQLKKIIKQDEIKIIPRSRKNEVLSFITRGLEDICVSRSAERASGWGIDVPNDSTQKIWVWFDALSNYINALGYAKDSKKFQKWWQENENKLHIIGKGVLRFHAIYWPAILLSAGFSLPSKIFVHGYITSEGQKMSKSLGNVINPFELVKKYDTDALRYYLLREIPPTKDGDFSYQKFKRRYNDDLAKGVGNLVSRTITLAQKTNSSPVGNLPQRLKNKTEEKKKDYKEALDQFKFNKALVAVWDLISFYDRYIEEKKPWQESENQEQLIEHLLLGLQDIAGLLEPILPQTSKDILNQIKSKRAESLFPRV